MTPIRRDYESQLRISVEPVMLHSFADAPDENTKQALSEEGRCQIIMVEYDQENTNLTQETTQTQKMGILHTYSVNAMQKLQRLPVCKIYDDALANFVNKNDTICMIAGDCNRQMTQTPQHVNDIFSQEASYTRSCTPQETESLNEMIKKARMRALQPVFGRGSYTYHPHPGHFYKDQGLTFDYVFVNAQYDKHAREICRRVWGNNITDRPLNLTI